MEDQTEEKCNEACEAKPVETHADSRQPHPCDQQVHTGQGTQPQQMTRPAEHEREPGQLGIVGDVMGVAVMLEVKGPHEGRRHGL